MGCFSRRAAVALLGGGLLLAGCSAGPKDVDNATEPAPAAEAAADGCAYTDAPLLTLPPRGPGEPTLELPQPRGWERNTTKDSETVRGVIVNTGMRADDFTPNAVVTLVDMTAKSPTPQQVIDIELAALSSDGVPVETADTTLVCGHPAMTVGYTLESRPVNAVIVGVAHEGKTFSAVVTMQTADPTNADYVADMDTILSGFRVSY